MLSFHLLLILLSSMSMIWCKGLKVSQIKLPSSHHVKYMPAGYKDQQSKVNVCPAPSTSTSGAGNKRAMCKSLDKIFSIFLKVLTFGLFLQVVFWQLQLWGILWIMSITTTTIITITIIWITKILIWIQICRNKHRT